MFLLHLILMLHSGIMAWGAPELTTRVGLWPIHRDDDPGP